MVRPIKPTDAGKRNEPKCCVCNCTYQFGCAIGCAWGRPVRVTTNAQMRKPELRPICTVCETILLPLLERREWKNVLPAARKIRRKLERIGVL